MSINHMKFDPKAKSNNFVHEPHLIQASRVLSLKHLLPTLIQSFILPAPSQPSSHSPCALAELKVCQSNLEVRSILWNFSVSFLIQ